MYAVLVTAFLNAVNHAGECYGQKSSSREREGPGFRKRKLGVRKKGKANHRLILGNRLLRNGKRRSPR
ncbi:MAG: hypothetical protein JWN18_141 [Parcubacteria group bacterium]|nr:hypothetical protein [Parcubacteria group bacterium]